VLEIRPVEPADLPRVAAIHVDSWRAAYRGLIPDEILDSLSVESRVAAWEKWLANPDSRIWVAVRGDRTVGFSRLRPATESDGPADFAEVSHLYLDPSDYASGVGAPLFERALEFARAHPHQGVVLWVLERNTRARRFYERRGFAADGARQSRPEWLGEGVYQVRYRMQL